MMGYLGQRRHREPEVMTSIKYRERTVKEWINDFVDNRK